METSEILKLIENLLTTMGVRFDDISVTDDSLTKKRLFIIKTQESGLLIGDGGETFKALSHLVRRIAGKGVEEMSDFSIDVNDYRANLIDKLKMKAGMLANRARDMRSNVEMEPMSSYERLIIHGALTGEANIKTESTGEGKARRVIIKYID
ncbi:MAG: R3H domain-containing nucleic acid-binding protein [Candidatus Paceibacterota bacterium]|jgi:spoIIIJ-associated protein